MRDKTVKDVMTPVESVYMLEVSGIINRRTVKEVSCHHSFICQSRLTFVILLFDLCLFEFHVVTSVIAGSPWPLSCTYLPRYSGQYLWDTAS